MQADTADQAPDAEQPATSRGKVHRLTPIGNVNATVFENIGANGPFHTVDFQRSYKDADDKRHYTHSFKPTDMPDLVKQVEAAQQKLAELSRGRPR